jgi:hypothetical protein
MNIRKQLLALLVIFITAYGTAVASAPDKVTPEEVVAKHLASIGSADALASAKTRIAVGRAKAISHSNAVRDIAGVGQFASDGDKVLLAMIFNLLDYPYEKMGCDGRKMTVALLPRTGARTALGDFLMAHDAVFREGLIGGALSSAWPLLDLAVKKPKLSYSGMTKINGRAVHKLDYPPPRGAGDLHTTLFFDAETFRHVRTKYEYLVSARMGARPRASVQSSTTDTGSQAVTRYELVEEFSDFKTEGSLTLPHTYNLQLSVEGQSTVLLEWVLNFSQFVFNQPIEASAFNVAASK